MCFFFLNRLVLLFISWTIVLNFRYYAQVNPSVAAVGGWLDTYALPAPLPFSASLSLLKFTLGQVATPDVAWVLPCSACAVMSGIELN